ncbi:hypothetical protein PGTUg99_036147 [Puccinia graminis f. sp. tritici]|uniref:Checkpoint protein n=1 Tax=Puccinia graminis f. sp. tritici TaxID=56615 RepID=A0A5B0NQD5_PUCGR|nr:hypothetical protein PGTUg99_036147 [Puccinia graminis f. sp. tritici]
MRFRAHLANVATFTKLIDSVNKLARRAVFTFTPEEIRLVSTGDDEDGLQLHGAIKVVDLFGSNYHVESNHHNIIPLEFSTQALASAVRQTSSSPTEIVFRLGRLGRTPYLSLTAKTVGRSGTEYQVEQRVAVRVVKPEEAELLPKPCSPTPDVFLCLPKISDICKVAERLKSLSDLITVSASRNGGFRLGISTEHARVETEWRGLTPFHNRFSQATQDSQGTLRSTSAFFEATVKSRAFLRFLHAHIGDVSLASICEGYCLTLFNYIGDTSQLIETENDERTSGSLFAVLSIVNEDGDT